MRLTYSHDSYENKFENNLIGGNALSNLKKNNLLILRETVYSHKNNIKMF